MGSVVGGVVGSVVGGVVGSVVGGVVGSVVGGVVGCVVGSVVGWVVGCVVGEGVTIGSGEAGGFVAGFGAGFGVGRSGVDRGSTASRSPPRCSTRWTGALRCAGFGAVTAETGFASGLGASASGAAGVAVPTEAGWNMGVIRIVVTRSVR